MADDSHCIHMDEYFDHRNHPCIVSELYGMSVFDFLKQNSFSPFPERHIQDFAKSLLKSVDCLSLFLIRRCLADDSPTSVKAGSYGFEAREHFVGLE